MRFILKPSTGSGITWSDNIDGTSTGKESDVYLSPFIGLDLELRGKNYSFDMGGEVSAQIYIKNSDRNDIGIPFPGINGDLSYDVSERLNFSLSTYISYYPNGTSFQEPIFVTEDTTGAPITTTVTGKADSFIFDVSPSLAYRVTKRLTTTLSTGYSTNQYSNNTDPDLSDSNTYRAGLSFDYLFTREFSGGIEVDYEKNEFVQGGLSRGNDTNIYRATLTGSYKYLKNADLDISAGSALVDEESKSNSQDFIGSISTNVSFKSIILFVGVSSDISGRGSSFGNVTQNDSVRASLSTKFSRRGDFTLGGGLTHRVNKEETEDLIIQEVTARADYQLMKRLNVYLSGSATRQDARGGLGSDIDINEVATGFEIEFGEESRSRYAD